MPAEPAARKPAVEIFFGFALVWLLNIVQLAFAQLWAYQWTWTFLSTSWFSRQFLGFTQLFYLVPILIYAHRQRRTYFFASAVVAASITFLFTTACWELEHSLFGAGS